MDSTTTSRMAVLRPFACPACPSRFTRLENLNRHTRSVHRESNKRPFPCPHCDVSFSRSDLRKRHVKKCHSSSASGKSPTETLPPVTRVEDATDNGPEILLPQDMSWLFRLPQYIEAYFENFHPNLPALHQPTFDMSTTKLPLLQAIACIGSVCHSRDTDHRIGVALFDAGCKSLDEYIREHRSGFREVWVFQAYVLFEYFAIYGCREDLFPTALNIHRKLVDAAREFQMLQDGTTLNGNGVDLTPGQNDDAISAFLPLHETNTEENKWREFIKQESQKRIMYTLYYLDSQLAINCNVRPLLSALEVKYELPSFDDCWSAPTATAWSTLLQSHNSSFNMNEEDDDDGNPDPRPAHGDLYESLMHLIHPNRDAGQPLGLLWYSPFASLMLIIQMQMMIRDLTLTSIFYYSNLRWNIDSNETRHNLSIISEENRSPIYQALSNLADLIPKIRMSGYLNEVAGVSVDGNIQNKNTHKSLWHSVWIAWHYTVMTLTHQDALLTTGIVEYGIPTALSTCWELGKPRAKYQRDVYADRDVIRIVDNLEQIIELMNNVPMTSTTGNIEEKALCQEDPFVTMLGFKACMMGWRVVRLMTLGIDRSTRVGALTTKPSLYSSTARIVLARLMEALGSQWSSENIMEDLTLGLHGWPNLNSHESHYIDWIIKSFSLRDTWPIGTWMVAVFKETGRGEA